MSSLPFSQSCENNKSYILEVLERVFVSCTRVLEIGSGTGQHAVHFASAMPWLQWQPSEMPEYLPVVLPRCREYQGQNLQPPCVVDVRERPWQSPVPEALFTANTLHIMGFGSVQALFGELGERAEPGTVLAVYGPFNYGGTYTSESNARFDQWLLEQNAESAIRHFEDVDGLASEAGFLLQEDNPMPANNRLLVWRKAQ